MKNLSDILKQNKVYLKTFSNDLLLKYSLKDEDYKANVFTNVTGSLLGVDEVLPLSQPFIVQEINERYLKVGVDLVTSLTGKTNRYFLQNYNLQDSTYDLNFNAAKITRETTVKYTSINLSKPRFAAGLIEEIPQGLNIQELESLYIEQIKGLYTGKIDVLYLKNFSYEFGLKTILKIVDELMQKRQKIADVFISFSNADLMDKFIKNDFSDFTNVNVLAFGFYFDLSKIPVSEINNCKQNLVALDCSKCDIGNYNIEELANALKNANLKVIDFQNGFLPDIISKIINFK